MKTRILFRTEQEAKEAAIASGKEFYETSANDSCGIETDFDICWSGEVPCYRTNDGDIFAWWE